MSDATTVVLLVEDEPNLARVIARELTGSGFRVLHALDGASALQIHGRERPSVVILDWMLPGLSGLDVLRRLRETAPTPVLMLTARSDELDRVVGLEVGADDYLTKPFSMRELIARVRALVRRVELIQQTLNADRGSAANTVSLGPLRLDPDAHLITVDGVTLDLSPTEFALLQLLVLNPGRTFGRSYLLETIWKENYVGGDRSVDNAVLRLRKKLGGLGESIETVWGIGYRWKPTG